jgi:hypothetical protein
MLTLSDKTKQNLVKAGLAGALLAGTSTILYGNASVDVMGTSVPAMVPLFVAGSGSSLITDLIHDQLNLPSTSAQKLADLSALGISSGVSGAVAAGILKLAVGLPNDRLLPVFGLAAASQAGSEYITVKFLETADGRLIF